MLPAAFSYHPPKVNSHVLMKNCLCALSAALLILKNAANRKKSKTTKTNTFYESQGNAYERLRVLKQLFVRDYVTVMDK